MLEIRGLDVWYGGIHAVKNIDMSIGRGEIVTLIGANGAGKSSTIRAVAGLVRDWKGSMTFTKPEGGQVSLAGCPPETMVRLGISLSPEGRRILPHLTTEENLTLGAFTRKDREEIAESMEHVYGLFPKLRERRNQKGGTLSGGEQQMLAVARALMSKPELLMLDEPSLGLAPILVAEVFDIIREINRQGRTILLVEQNAYAALKIAHKAYVLETGEIALSGTGAELLENPKVREAYLGG
ncbi:MAG: ABC transporter ATP-binding protein [Synergistaceae bacterium]|jgi:branched-chain amino acid transport system ATP-binding protein|nr:ABC transporter ATP-binding protein [Synergistaceae bacterium]